MDYQIPARGNIYDRTGLPIVAQSDAYALGITPGQMSGKSEAGADRRACTFVQTHARSRSRMPYTPTPHRMVCRPSVTPPSDETKGVLDLNAGGLTVTPYSSRYYLDQGIAPQVVGYASLIQKEELDTYRRLGYRGDEKVGQSGIEKSMEQYLAGKHGGSLYVVDPNGQIVTKLASQ